MRGEDKREGYPLEIGTFRRGPGPGIPVNSRAKDVPPSAWRHRHGARPAARDARIRAVPVADWPGAPLQPTGNPMLDGVGPAAYALRADTPDLTVDGLPSIVPLRFEPECFVAAEDPDPRGMTVIGADREVAGVISDLWIDRTEPQIRYLEVAVANASGQHVLLPITMARIDKTRRVVRVRSILGRQFADAPALARRDQVTKLEEDRITAYFAGGLLYATPGRMESLL